MVRFLWHVEDGLGASVGPGQLVYLRDHGVLQATVEIEMPGGSGTLEACMNIPQNYNTDSGVKELGIVIAHGSEASDWRGRLLAELAVSLARSGFLVMRYICHTNASEARRVAVFEKAADVAATSPYARGVTRWVLAGLGDGARVAALAGSRVRSAVAGFVFMSYPLKEEMPDMPSEDTGSAQAATDSSAPLMGLVAPMLFVSASNDPLISEPSLVELGPRLVTSDVRSVVLQDVDSHFRTLTGKGPHAATIRAVNAAFHEFVNASNAYRMDYCKLPRIWRGGLAGGTPSVTAAENGGTKREERPQLQRAACFRPIPSGPPPHVQQQQQPLALQASLPYGLSATAAQALAAQIQQRQASSVGASGTGGNAAQLLAQQVLLQQAAQAAQRRSSDQADVGPASMAAAAAAKLAAAAAARGGGGAAGAAAPNQLAGLAHMLSDPNAAAQIAAMLLRNNASQQQQQQQQQVLQVPLQLGAAAGDGSVGSASGRATAGATNALLQALAPTVVPAAAAGGGTSTGGAGQGSQSITMEALTSALVQRLAQQQQPPPQQQQQVIGHSAAAAPLVTLQSGTAGHLLAATLLNQQQQQQLQLGPGSGAAALQQQQLQQLLLQHQRQQQQQQRQQLTLQLQEQLFQRQQDQQGQQRSHQGLQPALLLQSQSGSLIQAALRPAGLGPGAGRAAALAGPGGVLMLHASGSVMGGGVPQSGLSQDGEDIDMADAGAS